MCWEPIFTCYHSHKTLRSVCGFKALQVSEGQYTMSSELSLALCSSPHWLVKCWVLCKQVTDCVLFITRYRFHCYSSINLCSSVYAYKDIFSAAGSKEPYVHHSHCQSENKQLHINGEHTYESQDAWGREKYEHCLSTTRIQINNNHYDHHCISDGNAASNSASIKSDGTTTASQGTPPVSSWRRTLNISHLHDQIPSYFLRQSLHWNQLRQSASIDFGIKSDMLQFLPEFMPMLAPERTTGYIFQSEYCFHAASTSQGASSPTDVAPGLNLLSPASGNKSLILSASTRESPSKQSPPCEVKQALPNSSSAEPCCLTSLLLFWMNEKAVSVYINQFLGGFLPIHSYAKSGFDSKKSAECEQASSSCSSNARNTVHILKISPMFICY